MTYIYLEHLESQRIRDIRARRLLARGHLTEAQWSARGCAVLYRRAVPYWEWVDGLAGLRGAA
jgi:hypothetical protein